MAAPAASFKFSFEGRDAKGMIGRITMIIGDTTNSAVLTDSSTLIGHVNAMSNAVWVKNIDVAKPVTYGTAAEYLDVEDKAILTFKDPQGYLHRFQIAAPKTAGFLADKETVDSSQTDVANVITDFQTFVYGRNTDTSPLVYVAGFRVRRKIHRKFNSLTKNPALTGPGL